MRSQAWLGCSRNEALQSLWPADGPAEQGGGKGFAERFADSLRRETFSLSASASPHS